MNCKIFPALVVTTVVGAAASLSQPTASSPSSEIAFLRLTSGYWQLWVMNDDGSAQRQVTHSASDKAHAAWRPGSREILYHTNDGESFLLDLDTNDERRVLEGVVVRDAAFSPDGQTLAYGLPPEDKVNGKTTLWSSRLGERERRQLAGGVGIDALAPAWLSESAILYRQCVMTSNMEVNHDLWVVELDRGNAQRQIQGDDEPLKFDQAISPQGLIVYSSVRSGFYEIWTLPLEGGEPRQLTHLETYAGNPTWSPDGASLAFDSDQKGTLQIYRMTADGTEIVPLTTTAETPSRKPVWRSTASNRTRGAR